VGTAVLAALMVLWVAAFVSFLLLRFNATFFAALMGTLAALYGLAIIIFREQAADLFSRYAMNRVMFTNTPRYRPGYLAFFGGGMLLFGCLLLATSLRRLAA
jgi:hypothetical protein